MVRINHQSSESPSLVDSDVRRTQEIVPNKAAQATHRRIGNEHDYIRLKNEWLRLNPCASSEEITRAFRAIAHDLGI